MGAVTYTVAFEGVEAREVEVQCALSPGVPNFSIVGLPNKAVTEAKERVRAALTAMAIALPSKRITVNLSPANLPKDGSHYDLPIALALLAAIEAVPPDAVAGLTSMGELSLEGQLVAVAGALPAAVSAAETSRTLICPAASASEAAWVETAQVIGAPNLAAILRHLLGQSVLQVAARGAVQDASTGPDMADVRGQERAKRALEIAAAGRHHVLIVGAPGSGKSMMAERVASILPPLTPPEALETSMVHSVAGRIKAGGLSRVRPFEMPHHTASPAAIVGGGRHAGPGQMSLAHNGVLFMDEFPEFPRSVLETLRQPIETGEVVVSRANAHVTYPCRFMLIAAANPCRCGYLADPNRACARVPDCGADYLGRISGPLLDRFDLRVEVPPVHYRDLDQPPSGEPSAAIAARVAHARGVQEQRQGPQVLNADLRGTDLDRWAEPDNAGRTLLHEAAERLGLSARGYHRVLRVARTIADLAGEEHVCRTHLAEALSYRLVLPI